MRRITKLVVAGLMLAVPLSLGGVAAPANAGLPAGRCGASEGCGCGGVYVLKYKFILAYCG